MAGGRRASAGPGQVGRSSGAARPEEGRSEGGGFRVSSKRTGTLRSNLDLIVVLPTKKRFLDRYDDLLSELTLAVPGRDVDLLVYTPEELQRIAERPFIRQALQQGVTIYESRQEPA
jgi:hypothetical protein